MSDRLRERAGGAAFLLALVLLGLASLGVEPFRSLAFALFGG